VRARQPTTTELAGEKAILSSIVCDLGLIIPYAGVGIWSGALTMVAEALRGGILVSLTIFTLRALRKINRGEYSLYDYGTGKLEQLFGLVVALELAGGGAALVYEALKRLFAEPSADAGGGGMVVAMVFVTLNMLLNIWQFIIIRRAARASASPIVRSQLSSRRVATISSIVVVSAMAIKGLTAGQAIAQWADSTATVFVALYMIKSAFDIIRGALPDLLDRTLDEDQQVVINRHLALQFDHYASLIRVGSRRTGTAMLIEVELGFPASSTMGEIQPVVDAVRGGIETDIPNARATVIPRSTAASDVSANPGRG